MTAKSLILLIGGEGGIRTPDTVARMPHFECGAFNRSATSPNLDIAAQSVLRLIVEGPVATLLLPNRFRAPVYYVFQIAVNTSGSVFLHSRQNVRIQVQVHRDPDL